MTTRIIAGIFAFLTMATAGILTIAGFAAAQEGETVFQEIAGICLWIVAAVLFVATLICVRIQQEEDSRRKTIDRERLVALMKTVEEIRDRGYDTVDRLDELVRKVGDGVFRQ